jgi:NAD(P)-dependent dehydrogenase (short-subunit alcohol dehydrogenase family)
MTEFNTLKALVTGGGSGIGAATAQLLHERGARVAVLDLNIDDAPAGCSAYQTDVTDDGSVHSAVKQAISDLGGLDILVNNAGIAAQGTVSDNDLDEWRRVFDINVLGIVRVTQNALPALQRSPHGAIVNTCSIAATAGLPNLVLYSASKGAVMSLTLAMAADHVRSGIRVNCVTPGTVDTPLIGRLLSVADDPDAEHAALIGRQPMGRLVTAAEVAHAIAYLASPLTASTTGEVLGVDGGMQALRVRPS